MLHKKSTNRLSGGCGRAWKQNFPLSDGNFIIAKWIRDRNCATRKFDLKNFDGRRGKFADGLYLLANAHSYENSPSVARCLANLIIH